MNRAVAIDAGDIGGPNHGIRSPEGYSRRVCASSSRAAPHRASSAWGASRAISRAPASTKPCGSSIAGDDDVVPGGLVGGREHRHLVGPQQVGDLGGDVPPGRRGRGLPAVVVEAGDGAPELVAL